MAVVNGGFMPRIVRELNKSLLHGVLTAALNMVCNPATMSEHPDKAVIDALGGPAEVARLLSLDTKKGGVQRVHNWRTRGIPPAVRLDHPELFGTPAPKPASARAG
jgi:hypothetical protein